MIAEKSIKENKDVLSTLNPNEIEKVAKKIVDALKKKKKIFICGNGGSAADSQHFAAELVGRYLKEREGLPAIALTTDTSNLTAIGNDYGFDKIFERQVEALGQEGDILVGISTSGNSKNIINAVNKAKEKKMFVIGLLGRDGGELKKHCHMSILIPSKSTPRIQEMHGLVIHIVCEIIDESFS